MSGALKALFGAGITFPVCAVVATPSGDPFTMIIVGIAGAMLAFFLFWWLMTRRVVATYSRGQQVALSAFIIAFATLAMYLLTHITAS